MNLIQFPTSDAYNVTAESITYAEIIAKLPGITVRDVRHVLGVPPLTGDEALVNDIVLNLPTQESWEAGWDGPMGPGTAA